MKERKNYGLGVQWRGLVLGDWLVVFTFKYSYNFRLDLRDDMFKFIILL